MSRARRLSACTAVSVGGSCPHQGAISCCSHRRVVSSGWSLADGLAGRVRATRDDISIVCTAAEIVDRATGKVSMPAVRPALHPGYLTITGPAGEPTEAPLRCYIAARASSSVHLVRAVAGALAERELRFVLKAADTLDAYHRRDSIVVYVPVADRCAALAAILEALPPGGVSDATPILAQRVASGVATAESPRLGTSFGLHRSTVLARALRESAVRTDTHLLALARDAFAAAGIDPDAPWRELSHVESCRG